MFHLPEPFGTVFDVAGGGIVKDKGRICGLELLELYVFPVINIVRDNRITGGIGLGPLIESSH